MKGPIIRRVVLGLVLGGIVILGQNRPQTVSIVPDVLTGFLSFALVYIHVRKEAGRRTSLKEGFRWQLALEAIWMPALIVGGMLMAAATARFDHGSMLLYATTFVMGCGVTLALGFLAAVAPIPDLDRTT